jgi:hypothetical protein
MPEATLLALASRDWAAAPSRLQEQGAAAFAKSWEALMKVLDSKSAALQKVG